MSSANHRLSSRSLNVQYRALSPTSSQSSVIGHVGKRRMKQRVRLWLRGERAFGLQSSVALPRACAETQPQTGDEGESRFATAVSEERSDLFEGIARPNEMAPMGGLIAPPS